MGLRPSIKLPLDDHREHSHFARHGDAVCVETLLVRENPNCFCSDGAPDTRFFIGFARGRLSPLMVDGPALGNDPASRLPCCNEQHLIGFRESIGHDAIIALEARSLLFADFLLPRGCPKIPTLSVGTAFVAQNKKRMQQVHPPYSSPDLVAAPVESVVESGRAVLVAHVLCVKYS